MTNHFAANQKAEFYGGVIASLLVLVPVVLFILFLIYGFIASGQFK